MASEAGARAISGGGGEQGVSKARYGVDANFNNIAEFLVLGGNLRPTITTAALSP